MSGKSDRDIVDVHRVAVLEPDAAAAGHPVPMPEWPVWKSAGSPASAMAS